MYKKESCMNLIWMLLKVLLLNRLLITKFRIIAHRLEIETGRHRNITVNGRICKCCLLHDIKTEKHFI
jgi:hypothetical protein